MPILEPQQAKELSDALIAAFNPDTLPWVVRSSIGPELHVIVNAKQPFGLVVPDLIRWIESRGSGTLEAFLHRAIEAQPPNPALLQAFCQAHYPQTLQNLDPTVLVQSFQSGLQLLINLKDDAFVRQTVDFFRVGLFETSEKIRILKKYKGLHDVLHELQVRFDAIADALQQKNRIQLSKYALDLARFAKSMRAQTDGLPTRSTEDNWIADFDSCIRDIASAAVAAADPASAPKADEIVEVLKEDVLGQAKRINDLLVLAADGLKLDSFNKAMEAIGGKIKQQAGPQDRVTSLFDSAKSVGMLRARIDGLVAEHNEWNVLNGNLDGAERSTEHQPQARMPKKWQQFSTKLTNLCAAYPAADWSVDLSQRLKAWIDATPTPKPDGAEKSRGDSAFVEFQRTCMYRFYDVDKELNSLCGQITQLAMPIDMLLTLVQGPAGVINNGP